LIANIAGWEFIEFAVKMAPITIPVFIAGMITCFGVEKFRLFGFGTHLPLRIKNIFHEYNDFELSQRTDIMKLELMIEMVVGLLLIVALALHLAAVGIIGLGVIILLTSFKGITDEHDLGDAFKEALPFTALLVVFFAVVSVIADQGLFSPIIAYVLAQNLDVQAPIFFVANGLLSAISDNVFVATIYINEIKEALDSDIISRSQFDNLAIAINTGTNIPSIATPNGQAAFLFLLTSSLAPLIGLSYMRMVKMALPYTIVLSIVGFLSVVYFL
jgi:NhaB family Na+:H+ antiporter